MVAGELILNVAWLGLVLVRLRALRAANVAAWIVESIAAVGRVWVWIGVQRMGTRQTLVGGRAPANRLQVW